MTTPVVTPGPKVFYGMTEKCIYCGSDDEVVQLKPDCTLERALILCLTVYYVKELWYPADFGQLLGLMQAIFDKDDSTAKGFMSSKLKKFLSKVSYLRNRESTLS